MIWKQQKRKEAKHISVRARRMVWHTSLQHFWKHLSSPFTSRDTISRYSDCWARPQLYWEPKLTSWNNQPEQKKKKQKETFVKLKHILLSKRTNHTGNIHLPLGQVATKPRLSFQCKIYGGSCKALGSFKRSEELLIVHQRTSPHHRDAASCSERQEVGCIMQVSIAFLWYLPSAEGNTDRRLEGVM